eukprot:g83329.t1
MWCTHATVRAGGASCNGKTALHFAGGYGNTKMAQALLAAGAHIYAEDNFGNTALDDARERKKPETAKLLEEAAKVTAACAALCRLCQHTPCHSTQRQETFL